MSVIDDLSLIASITALRAREQACRMRNLNWAHWSGARRQLEAELERRRAEWNAEDSLPALLKRQAD